MTLPKKDYSCADCGADTLATEEYAWMVKGDVWKRSIASARRRRGYRSLNVSTYDLVCIKCFERRIHRPLTTDDFNWSVPLNFATRWERSTLLKERMGKRLVLEQQRQHAALAQEERHHAQLQKRIASGG